MFQKQPQPDLQSLREENYHPVHQDEVETVVGPSVHVEGDFSSEGNILVKGIVSGSVKTSKLLTVEPGAKIYANVHAGNAYIAGEIKGNVKVNDKLELAASAQILGDITCSVLAVEAGALIQGKVSMGGMDMAAPKVERKRTTRTRGKEMDELETLE